MKYLKKTRTKIILSRSGVWYKVIFNETSQQLKVIWLFVSLPRINRRKRALHYAFYMKGLNVEFIKEDNKSVTYWCPKNLRDEVLRIISKC